jgi:FkbM family methyltransferase
LAALRVRASVQARLDRGFPHARVARTVQGVELSMPRHHRLPQIAARFPAYGQNLVRLAVELAASDPCPVILDVGANIGDSAAQVLAAVDARVWCIEGDPYWLPFLHDNVGNDPRVRVTRALLAPEDALHETVGAVRRGGTTSFRRGGQLVDTPRLTVEGLLESRPWAAPIRLVKTDTDGFDTRLVPALVRTISDRPPVIFFEYDPELSVSCGDPRPEELWQALADHGYESAMVWDNFGGLMGRVPVSAVSGPLTLFERPLSDRTFNYWDVAAVHRDDVAGMAAVARVAPDAPELAP